MNQDNNAEKPRLGDPLSADINHTSDSSVPPLSSGSTQRTGDSGLGAPDFEPALSRDLSESESRESREKIDAELKERFEEKLRELAPADSWRLPDQVRTLFTWTLAGVSASLGLLLVVEGTRFASDVALLSTPFKEIATGGMALFSAILALLALKLLLLMRRFNRSPSTPIGALTLLAERRRWQVLATEKVDEAKAELLASLKSYKPEGVKGRKLLAMGLTAEELSELSSARNMLLDDSLPMDAHRWLVEYRRSFQSIIDNLARRRVKQYAMRTGVGAAISPIQMIDQMIVLYSSAAMVKDLMTIYHFRPAIGQTAVILARGVVHAYLSGMITDVSDSAADSLAGAFGDWSGDFAAVMSSSLGKTLSARTTEAALNGFLVSRLGKRAIAMLQPTRD